MGVRVVLRYQSRAIYTLACYMILMSLLPTWATASAPVVSKPIPAAVPSCAIFFDDGDDGQTDPAAPPAMTIAQRLDAYRSLAQYAEARGLLRCMPLETSLDILHYHLSETRAQAIYRTIDQDIDLAKEHWFNFEFSEALAVSDHALALIDRAASDHDPAEFIPLGEKKVHVLLLQALILKAMGKKKAIAQTLDAALAINPLLTVDALEFPPSYRAIFDRLKDTHLAPPVGSLDISSNPPAATVYLNGVPMGDTPLHLSELPFGDYALTVVASRYHPLQETVTLSDSNPLPVSATLQWITPPSPETLAQRLSLLSIHGQTEPSPAPSDAATARILALIKAAFAKADALEVDKIVVLSAVPASASDPNKRLEVRILDRTLHASHRPLAAPFDTVFGTRQVAWHHLEPELSGIIRESLLRNPNKTLDPRTGDLLVLSKSRKPLYRRPEFWIGVGAAVIGGTVGGILATRGDGDSPTTDATEGGINVGLENF